MSTPFYPQKAQRSLAATGDRGPLAIAIAIDIATRYRTSRIRSIAIAIAIAIANRDIDSEPVPYGNGCMKSVHKKQEMAG